MSIEELKLKIRRAAKVVLDALAAGLMDQEQDMLLAGTEAVLLAELLPEPWNRAWDM
jgi:hypothetical protein